jgi:cytochrome P450
VSNLVLLLVAGFETTTNLLGNGLALMLAPPGPRPGDAGAGDVGAFDVGVFDVGAFDVGAFVEEVLRYDSPVQLTSRWCREEVTIAGVTMIPYSQVLVLLGAGNRDPHRYRAPDVFDPGRSAIQPLSFGAGPHFCLGAALARMEAQIAFAMLAQRGVALAGPPIRRRRLTLRGYAELPVTVSP